MELYLQNQIFALISSYAEKDAPKNAGFFWHGDKCKTPQRWECRACKANIPRGQWWTADTSRAVRLIEFATAEAKEALTPTLESLSASRSVSAQLEIPVPEGEALLGFQKAFCAYAKDHPNILLGDEMGLGKSIQALAIINQDSTLRKVLIIVPAGLRLNWEREARKWLVRPIPIFMRKLGEGICILGYEDAKRLHSEAIQINWDLLIVDEAHFCKNPKAQRTQAILGKDDYKGGKFTHYEGLADKARRKLFLTGTPLPNKPVELWTLLHCLAPEQFKSFWTFVKRYCGAHQNPWGAWDFNGSSNLEELQQAMRTTCMIRRLKRDVLSELPPKRRQIITLEPTAKAIRILEKERDEWDQSEAHAAAIEILSKEEYKEHAKTLQANRISFFDFSRVRHELALEKAPQVADFVQNMLDDGTEKVIVFAHHRDVVMTIHDKLATYGVVTVMGGDSDKSKQDAIDRFQEGVERVFIGTIGAAGTGITLTRSSTVVFAELSPVPGEVSQAEDRAHRIGQHDSVNVYHLVYDNSLDAHFAQILVKKQTIADKALDNKVIPIEMKVEIKPPARIPSPEIRFAAREAMRYLAERCDGAREIDGQGFNKFDTDLGKNLAKKECLTDRQVWLAISIARRYKRQLNANGFATILEL